VTEPLRLKFDGNVSLPMLAAVVVGVASGAVYVNSKFDQLARVVEETAANSRQIDDLRQEILKNRQETLENRRVYLESAK